jgi:hypothetical protein
MMSEHELEVAYRELFEELVQLRREMCELRSELERLRGIDRAQRTERELGTPLN